MMMPQHLHWHRARYNASLLNLVHRGCWYSS